MAKKSIRYRNNADVKLKDSINVYNTSGDITASLLASVESGEIDPSMIIAYTKKMGKVSSNLLKDEKFKKCLDKNLNIDLDEKKSVFILGVKISNVDKETFDYKKCGNTEYNELCKIEKDIDFRKKEIEKVLKDMYIRSEETKKLIEEAENSNLTDDDLKKLIASKATTHNMYVKEHCLTVLTGSEKLIEVKLPTISKKSYLKFTT